jgi:hypothetical protein
VPPAIKAIETHYAGCRFRSRLEARWAVFFDCMDISWQYEPEGFTLSNGRRYLPDFLLTDCGTWVEVKGHDAALDIELMRMAAEELPIMPVKGERGPSLLILGPIPDATRAEFDFGWAAFDEFHQEASYGFGSYQKNSRPWWLYGIGSDGYTTPVVDETEPIGIARDAYIIARSARFEHGESPRSSRIDIDPFHGLVIKRSGEHE